MEFGLDESQTLFARSLKSWLEQRLPLDEVRRLATSGSGSDAALQSGAAGLGLPGLLVPEAQGGNGTGMFEAALASEALGYAAAPLPFLGPMVLAPLALRALPDSNRRTEWLQDIAAGKARFGAADGSGGTVTLDGEKLTGSIDTAIDCAGATHLLLLLEGAIAIVATDAPGVSLSLEPSFDRTRPISRVALAGATAEPYMLAPAAITKILDAGRVVLAADTLGAAQSMLDRAVSYSGERQQFGRLIGSFQSVKHQCADMAAALEPCRALVWYAAHAQDSLPDEARLAALHAKAHLAETGREVARLATEVHGGMGFTDLMGMHYWLKRIATNRHLLGSPEQLRREAARLQWPESLSSHEVRGEGGPARSVGG